MTTYNYKNGLKILMFKALAKYPLVHGIFTRIGGVSKAPFDSLNLGESTEDLKNNIYRNIDLASNSIDAKNIFSLEQEHGSIIHSVSPLMSVKRLIGDGLSTNSILTTLLIIHADCQAAIFYDPITNALSNIHCGIAGLKQNIYKTTINHMGITYNSNPKDIIVCISPCLGGMHAEYVNYKIEFPDYFCKFMSKDAFFDLEGIARHQLINSGIQNYNIYTTGICTYSNPADFFSYRRDKQTGRNGSFAYLASP